MSKLAIFFTVLAGLGVLIGLLAIIFWPVTSEEKKARKHKYTPPVIDKKKHYLGGGAVQRHEIEASRQVDGGYTGQYDPLTDPLNPLNPLYPNGIGTLMDDGVVNHNQHTVPGDHWVPDHSGHDHSHNQRDDYPSDTTRDENYSYPSDSTSSSD